MVMRGMRGQAFLVLLYTITIVYWIIVVGIYIPLTKEVVWGEIKKLINDSYSEYFNETTVQEFETRINYMYHLVYLGGLVLIIITFVMQAYYSKVKEKMWGP